MAHNTPPRRALPPDQAARVIAALRSVLRDRFGGNQSALARALGRKQQSISFLLNGTNSPSFETASLIAAYVGRPLSELLARPGEETPKPPVLRLVPPPPADEVEIRSLAQKAAMLLFDSGVPSEDWPRVLKASEDIARILVTLR